jgi:hypothetical protein
MCATNIGLCGCLGIRKCRAVGDTQEAWTSGASGIADELAIYITLPTKRELGQCLVLATPITIDRYGAGRCSIPMYPLWRSLEGPPFWRKRPLSGLWASTGAPAYAFCIVDINAAQQNDLTYVDDLRKRCKSYFNSLKCAIS